MRATQAINNIYKLISFLNLSILVVSLYVSAVRAVRAVCLSERGTDNEGGARLGGWVLIMYVGLALLSQVVSISKRIWYKFQYKLCLSFYGSRQLQGASYPWSPPGGKDSPHALALRARCDSFLYHAVIYMTRTLLIKLLLFFCPRFKIPRAKSLF